MTRTTNTLTLKWWGYKHLDGGIHAKRFFDNLADLNEARNSPFVQDAIGPFHARNRNAAIAFLENHFGISE